MYLYRLVTQSPVIYKARPGLQNNTWNSCNQSRATQHIRHMVLHTLWPELVYPLGRLPGLNTDGQTTQNVLERRRDKKGKQKGLEKLGVDGSKLCWSSPQVYEWLGAFFTMEGPPRFVNPRIGSKPLRFSTLSSQTNLTLSIDYIQR
jgi:hypothetical protein